jgi:hypothetical protein
LLPVVERSQVGEAVGLREGGLGGTPVGDLGPTFVSRVNGSTASERFLPGKVTTSDLGVELLVERPLPILGEAFRLSISEELRVRTIDLITSESDAAAFRLEIIGLFTDLPSSFTS